MEGKAIPSPFAILFSAPFKRLRLYVMGDDLQFVVILRGEGSGVLNPLECCAKARLLFILKRFGKSGRLYSWSNSRSQNTSIPVLV